MRKRINVTPEDLTAKGGRMLGRSRKFDGACLMRSTLWAMPSGRCYHLIDYCRPNENVGGIYSRLFCSSRTAPKNTSK